MLTNRGSRKYSECLFIYKSYIYWKENDSTHNWKNVPISGLLGLEEIGKLILFLWEKQLQRRSWTKFHVWLLDCHLPRMRSNRVFCRKYFLCGLARFWNWETRKLWNPKICPCFRRLFWFLVIYSKVDQSENIFDKVTTAWEKTKQTK